MSGRCIYGDCRESMRALIDAGERVQMCVTSPPYFGLRDYGHDAQIGLEPTVEEYVANMVGVFRLVRDLLADDGTLWLNLGDSYASHDPGGYREGEFLNPGGRQSDAATGQRNRAGVYRPDGLKRKDLIGIPWRVAFALQADGWYLRSDIIWAKPNPMPESVTDRPTKAHEYLFLLTKRPTYYYDAAAIAEAATFAGKVVTLGEKSLSRGQATGANVTPSGNGAADAVTVADTRNRRTVWTIPTTPYAGAHFATFPPALIEPCILAGSREGDVVFDPFLGSGTTGEVATRLGRRWLGCELNEAYRPLIEARTAQMGLPIGAAV